MKIIAAVDGTPNSEAALDALVGMNLATDTEIKLVTVVRSDETPLSFLWKGSSKDNLQQEFVEASENALNQMVQELGKLIKGCKISAEVFQGDAKTQISEAAKKWAADLIIMGSRGNRGVDLIVLG
ncbi:MAG: universal stress protein, partial [Candidatus Obscuribacterales bacterium]|nr:universal stress protein [Candidatus Obscuribacterales bacterium]